MARSTSSPDSLSVSRLRERFRQREGLPLSRWLARERFKVATELLSDGLAVGEVARRVGYYGSPSAFCRAFKAHLGHSPGAWAKD